ncbi:hypothetical protein BX666DRAFT_1512311 [Dichotomocladium elegans]|nr:hypothetical protein BX666DRAFT_1512311 [Dichotomocladium elegans]
MNYLALPTTFFPAPPSAPRRGHGRRIVIAYDETRTSDALLDRIIRAGFVEPDDDIRIVHILQQHDLLSSLSPITMGNTLTSAAPAFILDASRQQLESKENMLKGAEEEKLLAVVDVLKRNSDVRYEVVQGDPKRSLVDYCKDVQPVMLITGSRGFGKIRGTILGSVSDYLAKHCPCPVMIVKVTDEEVHAREKMTQEQQSTPQQ